MEPFGHQDNSFSYFSAPIIYNQQRSCDFQLHGHLCINGCLLSILTAWCKALSQKIWSSYSFISFTTSLTHKTLHSRNMRIILSKSNGRLRVIRCLWVAVFLWSVPVQGIMFSRIFILKMMSGMETDITVPARQNKISQRYSLKNKIKQNSK